MLSVVAHPALQSIMTKEISSNEQGELQGSLVSIMSLTSIIGPLLYTYLFSKYTRIDGVNFPGAPYVAAMIFSIICVIILFTKKSQSVKA